MPSNVMNFPRRLKEEPMIYRDNVNGVGQPLIYFGMQLLGKPDLIWQAKEQQKED